ncbi:hypothetical protein EMIHUDRAFT_201813 [Emiliania huxleyi CCMP1516]|uniref:Uncharacterized protein n=2 Tax=Emiliania huxleyi TaxID=2903 RepID=A0A0D3KEJ4_EMIH1|nr:hypothetical protein EMIHUDRAFT_201813 [Emiliania huxleyi CCMP1516]EOD34179.1 hypothetical protein EMIHUDRAFT_201813 [Emiliania huxleyi CCMP1516]|eukprot:XP_005786608.1 hypothetical protein EMIHUDRAFT_201813 [Emiliania huxleyi CCMP1516]
MHGADDRTIQYADSDAEWRHGGPISPRALRRDASQQVLQLDSEVAASGDATAPKTSYDTTMPPDGRDALADFASACEGKGRAWRAEGDAAVRLEWREAKTMNADGAGVEPWNTAEHDKAVHGPTPEGGTTNPMESEPPVSETYDDEGDDEKDENASADDEMAFIDDEFFELPDAATEEGAEGGGSQSQYSQQSQEGHFTVAQLALQNLDFDHARKSETVLEELESEEEWEKEAAAQAAASASSSSLGRFEPAEAGTSCEVFCMGRFGNEMKKTRK